MHAILGAGGAIGLELLKELVGTGHRVRLVGRNPKPVQGAAEVVAADLSQLDQTIKAVSGSDVVYLLVGLKYDIRIWREVWPKIMSNAIEACKRAKAKLIFFDNVYMYGRVSGPMTEETPFNPCSRKGEVRAQIANSLLQEMNSGNLTGLIARSADFYGPSAGTSVANILVFEKFAAKSRAMCLVDDSTKHSCTFTPDAAKGLVMLAESPSAWQQTWHLPTAPNPPSGKELIEMIAREFGVPPKYMGLNKLMLKLYGLFDSNVRESYEMLYQNQFDYVFDSVKFAKAFGWSGTSYPEGIRLTAESYRRDQTANSEHAQTWRHHPKIC
jgi:nucleoside-diphosphate-sugar epimerase